MSTWIWKILISHRLRGIFFQLENNSNICERLRALSQYKDELFCTIMWPLSQFKTRFNINLLFHLFSMTMPPSHTQTRTYTLRKSAVKSQKWLLALDTNGLKSLTIHPTGDAENSPSVFLFYARNPWNFFYATMFFHCNYVLHFFSFKHALESMKILT